MVLVLRSLGKQPQHISDTADKNTLDGQRSLPRSVRSCWVHRFIGDDDATTYELALGLGCAQMRVWKVVCCGLKSSIVSRCSIQAAQLDTRKRLKIHDTGVFASAMLVLCDTDHVTDCRAMHSWRSESA